MYIRISVHVQVCKVCVYVWSIMYATRSQHIAVFQAFFFRWFAHGLVKPIGNSTKWTQSAVKRKAFEHGAKSMVTESAIRVIEIARCLFSKQTKTTGPQWTTLPCFSQPNGCPSSSRCLYASSPFCKVRCWILGRSRWVPWGETLSHGGTPIYSWMVNSSWKIRKYVHGWELGATYDLGNLHFFRKSWFLSLWIVVMFANSSTQVNCSLWFYPLVN